MDIMQVKSWVEHRIDYWEDKIEQTVLPPDEEDIEGRGMLAAFYMVVDFIDGQRR
jgi:hypothetical protein